MTGSGSGCLGLGLVGHNSFGGQQHAGNGCGIFQGYTAHLGGVNNTGLEEVFVGLGAGIETKVGLAFADLLYNDRAIDTGVGSEGADGLFQGAAHNGHAGLLISDLALHLGFEHFDGADIGYATTRHDAFLHSSAGSMQGVVYAVFLLLHFHFGSGTYIQYSHTAAQLGQALLQLFAVVVRGGSFDLCLDLVDAGSDLFLIALTAYDGGVVFVDGYAGSLAEVAQVGVFQLITLLFADNDTLGEDSDVLQHFLAAVAKAGGLYSSHLQRATQFVHHQGSQGFAFQVFCNDQQGTAALSHFLQDVQDILHGADLLVVDQDIGILQFSFHFLAVGNKVGADVAAVKLHTFHYVNRGIGALGFFYGDNTFLAYLGKSLGNEFTDGFVVVG